MEVLLKILKQVIAAFAEDNYMSITYEERIAFMLIELEKIDFHLYFDEESKIWECMSETSDFSASGGDKYQVIQTAFSHLMH